MWKQLKIGVTMRISRLFYRLKNLGIKSGIVRKRFFFPPRCLKAGVECGVNVKNFGENFGSEK